MSSNKPLEPNKTLIGIPDDFQAAVDKLRAQQGAPVPDEMQRTRMGNPHVSQNVAPPPLPANRPFQPPPGFQPAPPPAPLREVPAHARAQAEHRTLLGMPNNLQGVLAAADAARAARSERSGTAGHVVPQRAIPVHEPATQPHGSAHPPRVPPIHPEPRVHLHLDRADGDEGSAHNPEANLYATRLAPSELDDARGSEEEEDATDVVRRPRLALSERTTQRTQQPTARKLVPVLAAVLAVVVLSGGGWLAARLFHARPEPIAQPEVVTAPPLNVAQQAAPPSTGTPTAPTTTDVAAATQAEPVKPAPAAPPNLSGSPAELERQAIDLLIAKNYPAAAQAYERLRAADPDNKAYAVMHGLLTRGSSQSCGQPGQEPCANR